MTLSSIVALIVPGLAPGPAPGPVPGPVPVPWGSQPNVADLDTIFAICQAQPDSGSGSAPEFDRGGHIAPTGMKVSSTAAVRLGVKPSRACHGLALPSTQVVSSEAVMATSAANTIARFSVAGSV